mmetsp:Transcript_26694/g.67344  ORF Transcript_26694/g.67344 Transcript_26694/m.67344 type:complete len:87 (+) Transcript_26694:305-565(+)
MGCGGSSMGGEEWDERMQDREERRESKRRLREEGAEKDRRETAKSEGRPQGKKYRESEDREIAKMDRALAEEKKQEALHKALSVKW